MRKRDMGVCSFILAIGVIAAAALAGTVYTNDSGITARAFRIVFSEPVAITSFGGAFTVQRPEGKADTFVFTDGEAKPWDSFWLTWKPRSATVVKTEWLAEAPSVTDVTVVPHTRSETVAVKLVAADGGAVPCTITRSVSQEQVPFVVEYHIEIGGEGLTFHWSCEQTGETQEGADVQFILSSNDDPYTFTLVADSTDSHRYTWTDPRIDLPLHNQTGVLLDATRFVPLDDIESVVWSARNGDPADSVTFPILDKNSPITTLHSVWPNVLDIACEIKTKEGRTVKKEMEALIYFKKGTPFEIRSVAATLYDPLNYSQLDGVFDQMFPLLSSLGVNSITTAIYWWFGPPDSQGRYTVHPIYEEPGAKYPWNPRGLTTPPELLERYISRAKEEGFKVNIELRQQPYRNDTKFQQDYWGKYYPLRITDGFLYGKDGEGYLNMLMHYLPFFIEHNINTVFLNAECGGIENQGGSKLRQFFKDVIKKYREAGYTGKISYATNVTAGPLVFESVNMHPSRTGIPWADMDYVAVTYYPKLADSDNASTLEMTSNVRNQIRDIFRPFSEKYGKPLFIEDCVCNALNGCAEDPLELGIEAGVDTEEARRYHTAILRAFSEANIGAEKPLVGGMTMALYCLIPDSWMVSRPPFGGIVQPCLNESNRRRELQLTIKVFYSDKPLVTPSDTQ